MTTERRSLVLDPRHGYPDGPWHTIDGRTVCWRARPGDRPNCVAEYVEREDANTHVLRVVLLAVDLDSMCAISDRAADGDPATWRAIFSTIGADDVVVHAFRDGSTQRDPEYAVHVRSMGRHDCDNAWSGCAGWRNDPSWKPTR